MSTKFENFGKNGVTFYMFINYIYKRIVLNERMFCLKKPNTYLDCVCRKNNRYFFVSYSHADKLSFVFPVLDTLFSKGVNFWYDKELSVGDKWNEEVEKIINDDNCKGAIIFISKNALISEAVFEEVKRINHRGNICKDFKIIPIVCEKNLPEDLIVEVSNKNKDFFYNQSDTFKELFLIDNAKSKRLWSNLKNAVQKIDDVAKENNLKVDWNVNTKNTKLHSVGLAVQNNEQYIFLGTYKQDESENDKLIKWNLLACEGGIYFFVSEYCLDFIEYSQLSKFIDDFRTKVIPMEDYYKIDFLNEDFINKYASIISETLPTDYADKNRKQYLRTYWVKTRNTYALYNNLNVKINKKINYDTINAGVRLLLSIDNDKMEE